MPREPAQPQPTAAPDAGIAAALGCGRLLGPVLVVADDAAIAAHAPAWAAAFTAARTVHRVVVPGVDVVAAAAGLGPRMVMAVGSPETVLDARRAAGALGVPLVDVTVS